MLKKIKVRPGTQGERKRATEERSRRLRFCLQGRGMDMYDLAEALNCTTRTLRRKITEESWTLREYAIMQRLLTERHDDLMRTLLTDYEPTELKGYRFLRPVEEIEEENRAIWGSIDADMPDPKETPEPAAEADGQKKLSETTDEELDRMYMGLDEAPEPSDEEWAAEVDRQIEEREAWEREMLRSNKL